MAETYSTSHQNGIRPNMPGSKYSLSSTSKLVFFGPIQKQRWPPLSLIGWKFSTSPLQSLAERNLTKLDMKQVLVFNALYQVFFFFWGGGVTRKQICTSCQLYGMPYLLWFPIYCVARFNALPILANLVSRGSPQGLSKGSILVKKKKKRSDWSWIQPMAICLVNSWSYLPCQNYTALWVMTHFWRKKMAPLRKSKWGTPPKIHVSPWRNVLNPVWIVSRKNKEIM